MKKCESYIICDDVCGIVGRREVQMLCIVHNIPSFLHSIGLKKLESAISEINHQFCTPKAKITSFLLIQNSPPRESAECKENFFKEFNLTIFF